MIRVTPKINIGLRVTGRRPDGFHNIETLFYPVDCFSDSLEIEVTGHETFPALRVSADGASCAGGQGGVRMDISFADGSTVGWDPAGDLCAKAYRLLAEDFALPAVRIRLVKGIPVGAGLGGGSADCAATLVELNRLCALGLDAAALKRYAARLGSDCAFFIDGSPCLAFGRGEVMKAFSPALEGYRIEMAIPSGEHISTAEAYGGLVARPAEDAVREAPERCALEDALRLPAEQWKGLVINDFEEAVFATHGAIAALKEDFYRRGAVYASMTGSGAAVYGIFKK